jgi:lytic murein transglycosylase
MRRRFLGLTTALLLVTGAASEGSAQTAVCRNEGSFDRWLEAFRREAAAAGVSQATLGSALNGMTLDSSIIARDRGQRFFSQSLTDVLAKLATNNRLENAIEQIRKHRAVFARAEQEFGVPPAVITAFWALESDFGAGMGKLPVLRSLATLAYDCRRGAMFRGELLAALQIVDRGDLVPSEMIGSWAGELGQTQFLPTHYLRNAVDYDGDGKRNLMRSAPDIIGSTANFMAHLGWQRGQPWLEEVRAPRTMAWDQADIAIQHPRSYWANAGVTRRDGQPLPADDQKASLLLLMGRNGPAFLAYPNFEVYTKWNQALTYAVTAAYLATRIDGAPPLGRSGAGIPVLTLEQGKELQVLLNRAGFQVGEPDGKIGAATRSAVKQAQMRYGLPADSYPTAELIDRLRARE